MGGEILTNKRQEDCRVVDLFREQAGIYLDINNVQRRRATENEAYSTGVGTPGGLCTLMVYTFLYKKPFYKKPGLKRPKKFKNL